MEFLASKFLVFLECAKQGGLREHLILLFLVILGLGGLKCIRHTACSTQPYAFIRSVKQTLIFTTYRYRTSPALRGKCGRRSFWASKVMERLRNNIIMLWIPFFEYIFPPGKAFCWIHKIYQRE